MVIYNLISSTAVLISCLALSSISYAEAGNESNAPAMVVQTAQVHYLPQSKQVNASGRLANKSEQKLSFKTSGPVATILVDEGDRVKKGQLLATLNQEEINAQVAQSQSVYDEAKRNLKRYKALHDKNVVPVEQYQSAETRLEVAHSNLRIAQFNKKHSVIVAPDNGRILKRSIEANEMISPFKTAFLMSLDKGGWVIRSGITDKDIVRINKGDQADIRLDAYPGKIFNGTISEVGAASNSHSHLFEVEVTLNKTPLRLHSGFISRLSIVPSLQESVALLPIEAIVEAQSKKAKVFVLDETHQVAQQSVDIAWLEKGGVAIKSGLPEGTLVVTAGATYLHDGAIVAIQGQ